ncbi:hypothetical protein EVAR_40325_1 [Eumeta japonica]|uniref:Uncharacterized protein n=1 Tax=Eumeta variegata TaxID=151549 RepID=A0A4C1YCX5_EUMVA|nr:hypothetical protein EVAR_40325_1 [Eumeta japonica]
MVESHALWMHSVYNSDPSSWSQRIYGFSISAVRAVPISTLYASNVGIFFVEYVKPTHIEEVAELRPRASSHSLPHHTLHAHIALRMTYLSRLRPI